MSYSVSLRLTPGQVAALDALVRQEGGTVAGHIRTGLTFRLDLGEHRKAIRQIVREELKAALTEQQAEWSQVREQMVEANAITVESFGQLLASFLNKLSDLAPQEPPPAPAPAPASTTSATGGVLMPPRSR